MISNRFIVGDALAELRRLPDASVHCVITSPPYFGCRVYDVPLEIGQEPDIELWADRLAAVMAEIKRVLRPDGVVFLNLGDAYSRDVRHGAVPKSLLLGPERLLLRLSRQGWTVRNKVIWWKSNHLPSSVRDRFTMAWEPVFVLTRSPRYHFDLDAVRVPHRTAVSSPRTVKVPEGRPAWAGPLAGSQSGIAKLKALGLPGHPLGRNPGDVVLTASSNYRGAHHATFPEQLIEPFLLVGCPERVCARCGAPWKRRPVDRNDLVAKLGDLYPSCDCKGGWVGGLVLDPFMGAGTVALVAERLGRRWLGIDASSPYATLARERLRTAQRRRPRSNAA